MTSANGPSPWKIPAVADALRRAWDAGLDAHGRIDLSVALGELSRADEPEGEKLRWLAIWLEENVTPAWAVIRCIYNEAVRYHPSDPRIRHSFAVAALNYADFVSEDERPELQVEAIGLAENAAQTNRDDPDAHYVLGLALYERVATDASSDRRAERAFRQAVELRPDFAAARYYLACALLDGGDDDEALRHMMAIDEEQLLRDFGAEQGWRVGRRRELVAVWLFRLKRLEDALAAVEDYLDFAQQAEPGEVEAPERLAALTDQMPAALALKVESVLREARLAG